MPLRVMPMVAASMDHLGAWWGAWRCETVAYFTKLLRKLGLGLEPEPWHRPSYESATQSANPPNTVG